MKQETDTDVVIHCDDCGILLLKAPVGVGYFPGPGMCTKCSERRYKNEKEKYWDVTKTVKAERQQNEKV